MIDKEIIETSFSEELINKNRLFTILNDKLLASKYFEPVLYQELLSYTDKYVDYHNLSLKEVKKAYLKFIKEYNKDVRIFGETNKYPLELTEDRQAPSRIDYNIILLLSTFLNPHRFRIMQLIKEKNLPAKKGLFIGCGPGLEIDLTLNKVEEVVAYDLTLDDFLGNYYGQNVQFRNEFFDGQGTERYDSILEHLKEPFQLLENCKKVLKKTGQIYLTTATNIPQFDHLYNFEPDHSHFNKMVTEMGFKIDFSENIFHSFITKGAESKNKFYILSI